MFSTPVNIACNNILFSQRRILFMNKIHPSVANLYEAAASLRRHDSPAAVARALNVSPQRLQNWEERGISKEGALLAQNVYGVDANELRRGTYKPGTKRAAGAPGGELGELKSQVESLTVVLGAIVSVTAKHRPLEAGEIAQMIRGSQSLDLARHDLVADILALIPNAGSARSAARDRKRSAS